jgi:hypothetical protein
MTLAALIGVTCTFTKDAPVLHEDGVLEGVERASQLSRREAANAVQGDQRGAASVLFNEQLVQLHSNKQNKAKPKANAVAKKADKALDKIAGKKGSAKPKKKKGAPKTKAKGKKAVQTGTAVEKALQRAANAKILAMSEQQKALAAAKKAKEAATKATNAPLNKAGSSVVKRARRTAAAAALQVQTAKAALASLMRAKQMASKAILDKAGGKYSKSGYGGQGGYFGAALRTAFHNGELSERLKHNNWNTKTLKADEKKAFLLGKAKGKKAGFKKGVKVGEKKALPKAIHKAKHLLKKDAKAKSKAGIAAKKAADQSALKTAAAAEAAKVRRSVKKEEKKAIKKKKAAALQEGAVVKLVTDEEVETDPELDGLSDPPERLT